MKDKLIWRAANKYREWIKDAVELPPSVHAIRHRAEIIKNKTASIDSWVKKFVEGCRPKIQFSNSGEEEYEGIVSPNVYNSIAACLVPDLSRDLTTSAQILTQSMENIASTWPPKIPKQIEVVEEVKAIIQGWPKVSYEHGKLSVLIKNVVLSDHIDEVDFGDFIISLELSNPRYGLHIDAVSPVKIDAGYVHPHVSDHSLCAGDGEDIMVDALLQGRLEDYFRIVEAILRTYNDASPYKPLSEWYNPEDKFCCDHCGRLLESEYDVVMCNECGSEYCTACAEGGGECIVCAHWLCPVCVKTCESCEEIICDGHSYICEDCNKIYCRGCLVQCFNCENSFCDECIRTCADCGESICDDCSTVCQCCSETHCTNCVNKTCDECSGDICETCQHVCNLCDRTICSLCYQNECPDCGVPMCASCAQEHNCILTGVNHE